MTEIIGFIGTVLIGGCWFPQIIKTLKTKRVGDISGWFLAMYMVGVIAWLIYGFRVNSPSIISLEIICFFQGLVLVYYKGVERGKKRYRKKGDQI